MRNASRLNAAVFDFDGTLARPVLDFPLMKRRVAELASARLESPPVSAGLPALEWIEALALGMDASQGALFRQEAHAMIADMEREAAARTSLFDFVRPMLSRLRRRGVKPAVITRNSRSAVEAVFPDSPEFLSVVLTREDVAAVKPDPAHLLTALQRLGVGPGEAVMVGDHPLDVLTARRAGTLAGAVVSGDTTAEALREAGPDFLAPDAGALIERMERLGCF
jgi:phosphoglycolate phosphatase